MNKLLKKLSLALIFVIVAAAAMTLHVKEAEACGAQPFIGEICTFAFNFCPMGYAATEGQLMAISQNTALFSLLGTTYGGDGIANFALPDLRSRTVVGTGQGDGLSYITLGQTGGNEQVTLDINQIPSHTHSAATSVGVNARLRGTNTDADAGNPASHVLAGRTATGSNIYSTSKADVNMDASAIQASATATTTITPQGGGQPVDIRSPFLGLTCCIAVQGQFPSRP